ncbi:serine/threonine-protein kinase [Streptomyces sp. DSM 44915]|uniref:non-specific serine/threonine protein kinase n=1 Tax=Streptomyces chisholmiae TaxID=3075540 RepID=A0ABU2JYB8_9ACTN|nr:serine/threonine-protein kinase [Streptomyces sp. DSM 44915]MDT0269842.1 serine/threonine-protein kinase [Streptomyces sp. DSM 44915]
MREGMTVGGRYRVRRPLGAGGLGEVWEAVDPHLDRSVAVKFVTGVTRHPEAASRFAREARTLAALSHPGIVTVHDAGTVPHEGGTLPYLVMELLDGATWETAPVDSVVEAGAAVAEALAHVHAAKVVHRDVKPANIMVRTDGRVVLTDFGIARDDDSLTRALTTTGKFYGTPAYMAPEQFQGHPATPASDVYALGLVLLEKLTGHRLPAAQLVAQEREKLPAPLLALLTRMTSGQPEARPTAAECARALRAPARTEQRTRRLTVPQPWTRPPRREGSTPGPAWPRRTKPQAVLLGLLTLVMFLPGYSYDEDHEPWNVVKSYGRAVYFVESENFDTWDTQAWAAVSSVAVFVGLAVTLVASALLRPGAPRTPRLAGYAGAVVTVYSLLWQYASDAPFYYEDDEHTLRFGALLFYALVAAVIALHVRRDVNTRGPAGS